MEMSRRKGFIYTLESVIAAALMMGTVIFVIPEVQQEQPPTFEDINSAIESLDRMDQLSGNRSSVRTSLEPFRPSNYNLSVRTVTVRSRDEEVSGTADFNVSRGSKELLLWIDSASNLEITYRGDVVFDRDQPGYHRVRLDEEPGYLNFTGSSELKLRIDRYKRFGEPPVSTEAYSTNYIDYNGTLRELQVIAWR